MKKLLSLVILLLSIRSYSQLILVNGNKHHAGGGSITQVQTKVFNSTTNATSNSITFTSAPVTGDLMILTVVSGSTISGTPSGWTVVNSAVGNTGTYMYWKIAGASESATLTITLSSADACILFAMEYSGVTTLDKTAEATGGGVTTTIGTGTTAATTTANELIVALAGVGGFAAATNISSWSNSIVNQLTGNVSAVNMSAFMGVKTVSATGTQTATATLNGNGTGNDSGIIATFK